MKRRIIVFIICILVISISIISCSNEPSIYVDKDDSPLRQQSAFYDIWFK